MAPDQQAQAVTFLTTKKKAVRTKNQPKNSESRRRFSDLVNKDTQNDRYIGRRQRLDYHGFGIVLAKEIEYLCIQVKGCKVSQLRNFNKNRLVLGTFWMQMD